MLVRVCGLGIFLLAVVAGATPSQEKQDTKEVVGKVKQVDAKKKQFILSLQDKSDRTFVVNKETKFTGPRGADREEGLRDACMGDGYEVRVVPAEDATFA